MTTILKLILLGTLIFVCTACTKTAQGCFTYSQTGNLTITLDASCSKDTYYYHWTIDTFQTTVTTPILTYTFAKPGDYKVLLVVGNKKGRTKGHFSMEIPKVSKTITVN